MKHVSFKTTTMLITMVIFLIMALRYTGYNESKIFASMVIVLGSLFMFQLNPQNKTNHE